MVKRKTKEIFEIEANKIHGEYIYSEFIYKNNNTKGKILCPLHGGFWQRPKDHLNGNKCPKCRGNLVTKITYESFVERASRIHFGVYDYSRFCYTGYKKPGKIICPIHGDFFQSPAHHLAGSKCPECRIEEKRVGLDKFVKLAEQTHGEYDYSEFVYKNNNTKGKIICPLHGEFWQRPKDHLNGNGCPKCATLSTVSREEISFVKYLKDNNKSKFFIISQIDNQYNTMLKFFWKIVQHKYKPDAFISYNNIIIVIEYNGYFWHGPYKRSRKHPITGVSFKKIKEQTWKRKAIIESNGIEVIDIKSKNWKNFIKTRKKTKNINRLFKILGI